VISFSESVEDTTMEKFDSWAVAAALLARDGVDAPLHYTTLAYRVCNTGLTTLGEKGDNPEQTMGAVMRKWPAVFSRCNHAMRGYYRLTDREAALRDPNIQNALAALERSEQEAKVANETDRFRTENRLLKERVAMLERLLGNIAELASPFGVEDSDN
jgi:hypothetical protein